MAGNIDKLKRHRKKIVKVVFALSIVLLIIIYLTAFMTNNINPIIKKMSEAEVRAMAISSINNAVHIVIDESLNYKDFVDIQRDKDDNITLIQSNFVKINRLARDLANLSEMNISTLGTKTIQIPIGAFSGSMIFAGFGPPIDVRMMPIGSVLCQFVSSFDQTGINQTRHRLYIEVNTTISIVVPLEEIPLEIKMMVLVVENVIVGDVPDTYVNAETQLDALDLLP